MMNAPAAQTLGIRCLIVDGHRLFAEAVARTLVRMGLEPVVVTTTAVEAIDVASREEPELVLVDEALPDADGLALGRGIAARSHHTKVVTLAASEDASIVRRAVDSGFAGVIEKDITPERFVRTILAVLDGEVVMPSHPVDHVRGAGPAGPPEPLTAREREILSLLACGASTTEMAQTLHVSEHTVRTHIQNILLKLHLHSRLELTAFALRQGLGERRRMRRDDADG
jgi:DNA-binding NarL/FixJ family response regulator